MAPPHRVSAPPQLAPQGDAPPSPRRSRGTSSRRPARPARVPQRRRALARVARRPRVPRGTRQGRARLGPRGRADRVRDVPLRGNLRVRDRRDRRLPAQDRGDADPPRHAPPLRAAPGVVTMTTADSYDRLRDWVLGRLPPDESLLFQRELAANPALRAAADEFALVARATEPLVADVPQSRLRFEDVIDDTPTAA